MTVIDIFQSGQIQRQSRKSVHRMLDLLSTVGDELRAVFSVSVNHSHNSAVDDSLDRVIKSDPVSAVDLIR